MTRRDPLARKLLKAIRKIPGRHHCPDPLASRQDRADLIRSNAVAGRIVVEHGGTDCDGARSHGFAILPAFVVQLERFRDRMHEGAEGPCYAYVVVNPDREHFEAAYDAALFGPDCQFITA